MSSRPDLRLDWCSHQAAKYAVEHWHYSRAMPTPPLVRVGVWEGGAFIGCVLFSRGANRHLGSPYGLAVTEVAELTRVALARHSAPVSRIVAISMRLLKAHCPGLRLVISYADPNHGHVGTIYQAAGWLFLGQGAQSYQYRDARGRVWHQRQVSVSGIKPQYGRLRRVTRYADCQRIPEDGKLKYALPWDAEVRARLLPLVLSYPKRLKDSENRPANQQGEGGLAPTQPLHFPLRERLKDLRNASPH